MTILIVGGDYVTSLKHVIAAHHAMHIEHWDGRKKQFNTRVLPNEIRLIVVICDYISHSFFASIKKKAKQRSIPMIFCHRSINELKQKLQKIEQSNGHCQDYLTEMQSV